MRTALAAILLEGAGWLGGDGDGGGCAMLLIGRDFGSGSGAARMVFICILCASQRWKISGPQKNWRGFGKEKMVDSDGLIEARAAIDRFSLPVFLGRVFGIDGPHPSVLVRAAARRSFLPRVLKLLRERARETLRRRRLVQPAILRCGFPYASQILVAGL